MATSPSSLLSMIPTGSTDEVTVKTSQNVGEVANARQGIANNQAELRIKQTALKEGAALTAQQDLAQISLAQEINKQQAALTLEVSGTRNVLEAQEAAFREKLAEHTKLTQDTKGYSFFTHPIATIRNQVKLSNSKHQLNDMTGALNAGYAHIDQEYAEAAQKVQDFRSTVLNVNQANLNMKSHELQNKTASAELEVAAAEEQRKLSLYALEKQQYKTDDAYSKRDKELSDSMIPAAIHMLANNGSMDGYTLPMAKVWMENYDSLTPDKKNALTRVTGKLALLPPLTQNDGESKQDFNTRNVQRLIQVAGKYDGPEVAEIAASLGTTVFNPLYKLGGDSVTENLMANAEADYAAALGKTALTPAESQQAYRAAKAKAQSISAKDKINSAAQTISNDLTNRASSAMAAIPPFDYAGSAELMASSNISPAAASWFAGDSARMAIDHYVVQTGRQGPDIALNIMEGLKEVTLPNGKPMSAADRAKVSSEYVRQMFNKDYLAHGDHGTAYSGLKQVAPDSELKFQALIKLPQYRAEPFDITNAEDLLNLQTRITNNIGVKESIKNSQAFPTIPRL